MALHENRDIQACLYASISALSIVQDLGIPDHTSSLSSSFTSSFAAADFAETFPPRDFGDGIPLHIAGWHHFAEQVAQTTDGREKALKARSIFEYFVEEAIAVCDGASATSSADQLSGAKKVAQKTRSTAPSFVCQLRGFTVEEIPIFNIMEALCWIYTCSVQHDEIRTDREADLEGNRLVPYNVPSTVAAARSVPFGGAPPIIAFACTCASKKMQEKRGMAEARKVYVSGLRTLAQNCVTGSSKEIRNAVGNCPEFVAWRAICRGDGGYRSLCLNIPNEYSYKCCTHCDDLAKGAWDNKKIKIEDWFDKTSLKTGLPPSTLESGYIYCKLKKIEAIIQEGRGRKVLRRNGVGIGGGDVVDDVNMDLEDWDKFDDEMMDVDCL